MVNIGHGMVNIGHGMVNIGHGMVNIGDDMIKDVLYLSGYCFINGYYLLFSF